MVVIVVSILLAFAIDASWSQRLDRVEEESARGRLQAEFSGAADQLAELRNREELVLSASEALLAMVGPSAQWEGATAEVDALLDQVTEVMTFDPRQGTLASLIASGQLRLIRDADLRSRLAAWPDMVEDMREEQLRAWDEVQEDLLPTINDFVFYRPTVGNGVWDEHPFPSDHGGLLRSRSFAALLDNRRIAARDILDELAEAELALGEILRAL